MSLNLKPRMFLTPSPMNEKQVHWGLKDLLKLFGLYILYGVIGMALAENRWLKPVQNDVSLWICVALLFATHARYRFWPDRNYLGLNLRDFSKHWKIGVVWGLLLAVGGSVLTYLSLWVAELVKGAPIEFSGNNTLTEIPLGWAWLPAVVSVVVLAPLTEELFMRGMVYPWLRSRWGIWTGLLVSSLIFTLLHVDAMPYAFLDIFLVALLAAVLYERTGSLAPAMILHGTVNLLAALSAMLHVLMH